MQPFAVRNHWYILRHPQAFGQIVGRTFAVPPLAPPAHSFGGSFSSAVLLFPSWPDPTRISPEISSSISGLQKTKADTTVVSASVWMKDFTESVSKSTPAFLWKFRFYHLDYRSHTRPPFRDPVSTKTAYSPLFGSSSPASKSQRTFQVLPGHPAYSKTSGRVQYCLFTVACDDRRSPTSDLSSDSTALRLS